VGADLAALNGAAVSGSLAEPAVERDGGVGGADHSGRHAEKVPQSPPRALLTAGVGSGDGGGGRGEPAREEGVSRGRPRMERGVAAGQREGEVAVEEPGERRNRVGDALPLPRRRRLAACRWERAVSMFSWGAAS
jgi:hypothetical protein